MQRRSEGLKCSGVLCRGFCFKLHGTGKADGIRFSQRGIEIGGFALSLKSMPVGGLPLLASGRHEGRRQNCEHAKGGDIPEQ
jgi:hypothetical protein